MAAHDVRGGASDDGGLCSDVKVVDGSLAHKGELHVRVGVDSSGHDKHVGRIDNIRSLGNLKIKADSRNLAVHTQHISTELAVCVHHSPTRHKNNIRFRSLHVPTSHVSLLSLSQGRGGGEGGGGGEKK